MKDKDIIVTMADRLQGTGWHVREGEGSIVRWTGPSTTATIYLPLIANTAYIVQVRVLGAMLTEILSGTRLFAREYEMAVQN